MENSLWTFGCSFTGEYAPINCDPPNNYDLYSEFRGGSLPTIWAKQLADKLKLNYKNKGNGAISNYTIFYTFCDWCSEFKKGDTIIVQWTTIYRFLFANDSHFLHDILPSMDYSEDYNMKTLEDVFVNKTNSVWIQELIKFTKIINELCKEKGVNVFYWSYSDTDFVHYMKNHYVGFDETQWMTYYLDPKDDHAKLLDLLHKKSNNKHTIALETNEKVKDYHLGELGHKIQAEYFYNYIKNKDELL